MLHLLPKRQTQLDSLTAHAYMHMVWVDTYTFSVAVLNYSQPGRGGRASVGLVPELFFWEGAGVNVLGMGGKQKETGL